MVGVRESRSFRMVISPFSSNSGEIRDIDLDPQKDILTFEEPGTYNFYVASVIVRPDRKNHFLALVNGVFDFWCEQAPERMLGKIYGRVVSVMAK